MTGIAMTEWKRKTNNNIQNTTQKTIDRAQQTPLKTGCELKCPGRVNSSCSTGRTRCVTLVTFPVISKDRGKDRIVIMTNETYPCRQELQIRILMYFTVSSDIRTLPMPMQHVQCWKRDMCTVCNDWLLVDVTWAIF
jgi:hypothetical protein